MAYQMNTRTGRSFWDVTSAMQNAIRKGDYELAGYCLWELLPEYTPYLRKRLLVISAEDCFGVITKEMIPLVDVGDEESLTKAVSLLCLAKKNRDADYFVCNLMYDDEQLATIYSKEELGRQLQSAIRRMDVIKAGHYASALFQKSRKYFWQLLNDTAMVYYPYLQKEVEALNIANERMSKPSEETIFVAKSIVLMWTCKEPIENILAYPDMDFDYVLEPSKVPFIKPADECYKVKGYFPDWAYNWHTYHGKYKLNRDAVHAIENDQRLLTPLEENLFDDCTWNRDINACLLKHNPKRYSLPFNDDKRRPEEKFGEEK